MPSQIRMLENIQPSQIEIPSQLLLKWSICSTSVETFSDPSQYKYLLGSFSNGGYVPVDIACQALYVD